MIRPLRAVLRRKRREPRGAIGIDASQIITGHLRIDQIAGLPEALAKLERQLPPPR